MKDIEIAKKFLTQGCSLAVVKNGECLYTENGSWIHPIVNAYEKLGENMEGASIADTIMGKAAAVICIVGNVKSVFTPMISLPALRILQDSGINIVYERTVEGIMNQDRSGLCLAEKSLMDITDPQKAYDELCQLLGKNA